MSHNVDTEKLLAWHRTLLNEAMTIAYRMVDGRTVSDSFLEDLAFSLESVASRVRREKKEV
jgi:hypothetical protein